MFNSDRFNLTTYIEVWKSEVLNFLWTSSELKKLDKISHFKEWKRHYD